MKCALVSSLRTSQGLQDFSTIIFRLEELDLPPKFMRRPPCQQEQQRLKQPFRCQRILAENQDNKSDSRFVPRRLSARRRQVGLAAVDCHPTPETDDQRQIFWQY
jgi:hypothetical protein